MQIHAIDRDQPCFSVPGGALFRPVPAWPWAGCASDAANDGTMGMADNGSSIGEIVAEWVAANPPQLYRGGA
jgi:hypothetical protein